MNLKNKIVLVVSIMAIIIAATGFISSILKINKSESRYNELAINGNKQQWDLILSKQYATMSSAIKTVSRDRKLKKAIAKKKLAVIAENTATGYNLLAGQHILDSIQITDKSGIILFDAVDPSAINSINSLAKIAVEKNKILTSLSYTKKGKLQTELVFPITKRGKVIGVGSFASSINVAINDLKKRSGSQVYISSKQYGLISSSQVDLEDQLNRLGLPLKYPLHLAISKDKSVYSTTVLPLNDMSGNLLANIILIADHTQSYQSQQKINVIAGVSLLFISLIMIIFIYWFLNKSLAPLHSISKSLKLVSEGDFTVAIEKNKDKDEIAEIQMAISSTVSRLHKLISDVASMVVNVNSYSDSLNDSMQKNKNNNEHQNTNISQASGSIQEVTTSVLKLSQYSEEMTQTSLQANAELEKGNKIIHKTIGSIKIISSQIADSSDVINKLSTETETIASVLDVIKSIAEQINLLALNAAIEAARAGESGRGFAVVADEVRSLAGKTQESTEEIEKMIESLQVGASAAVTEMQKSEKEVSACVDLANETETIMRVIIPEVAKIKDKNIQVNDAINEQKKSIEEINKNIIVINQVAEDSFLQNSDTLVISDKLRDLSTDLEQLVSQFKV